jgi:hypothetical protein
MSLSRKVEKILSSTISPDFLQSLQGLQGLGYEQNSLAARRTFRNVLQKQAIGLSDELLQDFRSVEAVRRELVIAMSNGGLHTFS